TNAPRREPIVLLQLHPRRSRLCQRQRSAISTGGEQTTQVSVDLDLTVAVGSIGRHEQAMLCEDIGERSGVPLVPRVANRGRKGMQGPSLDFLGDQHPRLS